jgi:hypothetical protein
MTTRKMTKIDKTLNNACRFAWCALNAQESKVARAQAYEAIDNAIEAFKKSTTLTIGVRNKLGLGVQYRQSGKTNMADGW